MITINITVLIGFIICIVIFFFKKKIARIIISQQNKVWGFSFSERELKYTENILVIIAFLFFIITLMIKFGLII